ncbi:MAG: AMP-binding protein [Deltaproteobacteria bacterium]|nr:AMP-binding protein [Deltaproteobacteria bacterium]
MVGTISALLEDRDRPFTPDGATVGEIASLAAGIRETLARVGASADKPVCLCVEERYHLLAALLAAWAGAPPLIIPHAFHPELLREVQSTKPYGLILTDTAVVPPLGAAVVSIRECGRGGHPPTLIRRPESPFLWLFTGGSTGTPRIWSKTPGNLFGEALHLARIFGIGPDDLILSTAPPQHIYGLLASVLLPFVASARVVRHTCTFPREILGALKKEQATVLVSVPIHYAALGNDALQRFSLRLALSSAAPMDPVDAAFFLEKTGLAINEIYGSTETGGMATRVHGANHGSWEPFDCLDWRILSERLSVRSNFVSPDLPLDADGYYLTADRVAAAGEGRFRFLGRADHIVKIGGKRVDLDEIREEIRRIPGVKDACVSILPQSRSRRFRVGALVATELAAGEVRDAIQSMEEHHGLVRRVRVVRSIPMLPNGKIDRLRVGRLLSASASAEAEGPIMPPAPDDPRAR